MSGSRWVITPSWLSALWRSLLYSSFVYSCHLFLMSSASVRSIPFLPFIVPIFALNVPLVSLISWRDIWSFSFYCFSLFLCIDHWGKLSYLSLLFFGTLHSIGYIFPFLLCFLILFFSKLFVRPPQTTILPFCILLPWRWSWSLPPVQCHEPPSIVLQILCLSDLIPWIYLSLPLYNHKVFDLGHNWSSGFPHFLQFKSEFGNKEFMVCSTVTFQYCFHWLYRASPSLAAKNVVNLFSVLTMWWCWCVESCLVLLEVDVCHDQCILLAKCY